MINVTAKELFDIANKVNNPDDVKIEVDYEQFTWNITKLMNDYSSRGIYHIVVSFSNFRLGLEELAEYNINHDAYLEKYTGQQVLQFVDKLLDGLHGKGYYISYSFSGGYGTDLIRVLKISWQDDMNEQVEKPSLFKRITNFFG